MSPIVRAMRAFARNLRRKARRLWERLRKFFSLIALAILALIHFVVSTERR